MKTITLSYAIPKTITINIDELNPSDRRYIKLWLKDDDDLTDEEWDFLYSHNHSLAKIIKNVTGDNAYDVEFDDYE